MPAMQSDPRVGDLCNEIHAVFRRQNFKNISDIELPACHFVAPYKHVPHPNDEDLDEWAFQEKESGLSTRDIAMYNLALTTLADMVVFVADSKTAGNAEDLHIHCGETCAERKTPSQNTHLWHGSTIRISREEIEAHTRECYREYRGDLGVKWHTFETAKILLHELMHAMAYARLGWLGNIPFGSNKAVETGYEWENYVFGGVICHSSLRWSSLDDDASLMIRDWPAASTTRVYQKLGYPIDVLEEPSSIEMRWWLLPVLHEWFDRLFTTEFWEKTVPKQGGGALKVPRIRGYRVKVAEDGSVTFFYSGSEGAASYGNTIPAGYMEDYDGEVVLE